MNASKKPLFALLITLLFVSCGQRLAPKNPQLTLGDEDDESSLYDDSYNPNQYQQTQQPTQTNNTNNSAACTNAVNLVGSLYNNCWPMIEDNDDMIPSSCVSAFGALSYVECSTLSAKVRNTYNACSALLNQYRSYLPAGCQNVLRQLRW